MKATVSDGADRLVQQGDRRASPTGYAVLRADRLPSENRHRALALPLQAGSVSLFTLSHRNPWWKAMSESVGSPKQ